ncbi:MAG: Ig-like domain-containing protein [Longimicrobiaceae bacterium]
MQPSRTTSTVLRRFLPALALALLGACGDAGTPTAAGAPSLSITNDDTRTGNVYKAVTCDYVPVRLGMNDFDLGGRIKSGTIANFQLRAWDRYDCEVTITGGVTWSVTNPAIASLESPNSTGRGQNLRGKLVGQASLKVSYAGLSGEYLFTVYPGDPYRTTLSPDAATLAPSGTATLAGTVFDQAGNTVTDGNIVWTSSSTGVATVAATTSRSARVTASSVMVSGETTITAAIGVARATALVKVVATNVPDCYCPPGFICTCNPYP